MPNKIGGHKSNTYHLRFGQILGKYNFLLPTLTNEYLKLIFLVLIFMPTKIDPGAALHAVCGKLKGKICANF